MSNPATHRSTAVPNTTGGQATSARIATQAATGANISAAPSQKCDKRRKPLGITVAEQKGQHRQRGVQGDRVARQEQERAGHESQRARHGERDHAAGAQQAGRQVPRAGARIQGVEPSVGQPVEGHRRAAGRGHAHQDAQQIQPAERHGRLGRANWPTTPSPPPAVQTATRTACG